jgi:hypothetical protein
MRACQGIEMIDSKMDSIDKILSRFKVIKERHPGYMTINTCLFSFSLIVYR